MGLVQRTTRSVAAFEVVIYTIQKDGETEWVNYVSAFCEGKARFAILVDVVIKCTKKQR